MVCEECKRDIYDDTTSQCKNPGRARDRKIKSIFTSSAIFSASEHNAYTYEQSEIEPEDETTGKKSSGF